jgi:hypothetical protein
MATAGEMDNQATGSGPSSHPRVHAGGRKCYPWRAYMDDPRRLPLWDALDAGEVWAAAALADLREDYGVPDVARDYLVRRAEAARWRAGKVADDHGAAPEAVPCVVVRAEG